MKTPCPHCQPDWAQCPDTLAKRISERRNAPTDGPEFIALRDKIRAILLVRYEGDDQYLPRFINEGGAE